MYDIMEYKKKKEEESIMHIVYMIIDNVIDNLEDKIIYNTNFIVTGYNKQLHIILKKLKEEADNCNIYLEIRVIPIPTATSNIIIKSYKKNDMFLNFMKEENIIYNKINNKELPYNPSKEKLNHLYILHALQTAYYRAGYDNINININNKKELLKTCNKTKNYIPKIVLMDMLRFNKQIEEDRIENITKKLKKQ